MTAEARLVSVDQAPATRIFDIEDFANWALADAGKAQLTVTENVRRLRAMMRNGFNPQVFIHSPADAVAEARRILAIVKRGEKKWQFKNHVKVLNWLAQYAATTDERFEEVKWKAPAPPRRRPVIFTPEEIAKLRAYGSQNETGRGHRSKPIFKLRRALIWWCLDDGLRRVEQHRKKITQIDAVNQAMQVANPAKGGHARAIPLHPDAFHERRPLQAWLRARATIPGVEEFEEVWIATTRAGRAKPMTVGGLSRELREVGKELGFRVSFNRFRHYHASDLTKGGVPLPVMQELYGHASISSTAWYVHVDLGDMQREVELARRRRKRRTEPES